MKRALGLLAAGLAMPAGVAVANGASGGWGGPPPCKEDCHKPPPTTTTVTVTVPITTTVTQPGTTVTQPGTTTTVVTPAPPPTVVVTQGPTSQTVNITITINGVPQTITVPGTLPSSKACVNTQRTALLGPLPNRFRVGLTVTTRVNGSVQNGRMQAGRKVSVRLPAACGPVAFVVNDRPNTRAIRPVLRIWLLEGGNRIVRVGSPLPVPPIGLS